MSQVMADFRAPYSTRQPAAVGAGLETVRVLLVLDQVMLAQLVRLTLNHGLYETRSVTSAADAATAITTWQPRLILLSMEADGPAIMDQLNTGRNGARRVPVIGLMRRGDLKHKLAAFDAGVDDILTVPFAPEELLARVIALVRRSYCAAVTFTPTIKLGDLEIDILNRTVRTGSLDLRLTSLEQSLLYLLAANAGRVVSREEILDNLWGAEYIAESNVVDRQVRNLRARLQDDWRQPRFIATVPGLGYRFLAGEPTGSSVGQSAETSQAGLARGERADPRRSSAINQLGPRRVPTG